MDRKIEEFYARGRKDCAAYVTAILYEDGHITTTADEDKITEAQLLKELESTYPGHQFNVVAICGRSGHDAYYIVDGTLKDPLTGPDATWEDLGRGFIEKEPNWEPRPEADEGSAAVNPEIKRSYPDYGGRYQ